MQDTKHAKFTAATMGGLMRDAHAGDPKSAGEWVICDPLTFIAACEPEVVLETRQASCKIEIHDRSCRGKSTFDFSTKGNVRVLQSLNMKRVAVVLEQALT